MKKIVSISIVWLFVLSGFIGQFLACGCIITGFSGIDFQMCDASQDIYVAKSFEQGPTVPSAPSLSVNGAEDRVWLSWSPPASDGGSPITSYILYKGTSSGGETYAGSMSVDGPSNMVDFNVVKGQTYYYQVSAQNAIGEGARSSEVSVTVEARESDETISPCTIGFWLIIIIVIIAVALAVRSRRKKKIEKPPEG